MMRGPVTVHGSPAAIRHIFGLLIPAQPIAFVPEGLTLFPPAALDQAAAARCIAECPLTIRPGGHAPAVWPDPPAALIAGIYRRSVTHAPAPLGLIEIIQCPGEAFGPGDHPTTEMCLSFLQRLPSGPAIDVGCGSGLLALARARRSGGPIVAIDADPEAARQTAASALAAGLTGQIEVRTGRAATLSADHLAGHVVLANIPAHAHEELQSRMSAPPRALLVSGLTTSDARPILDGYRALGMTRTAASRRGRWECHLLVAVIG